LIFLRKLAKGEERRYSIAKEGFCKKGDENMNTRCAFGAILLVAAVLVYGCANYGTLKQTPAQDVTIDTLTKDWMNYTVSMTGIDIGEPTGIFFDPKTDGKTVRGDHLYRVESEESLSKMVRWLKFNELYYPFLWKMVGPDGQFYGYIYTGYTRFAMKMVDDKTMLLYGMPPTLRGIDRGLF
jgi:hypothetical protein